MCVLLVCVCLGVRGGDVLCLIYVGMHVCVWRGVGGMRVCDMCVCVKVDLGGQVYA